MESYSYYKNNHHKIFKIIFFNSLQIFLQKALIYIAQLSYTKTIDDRMNHFLLLDKAIVLLHENLNIEVDLQGIPLYYKPSCRNKYVIKHCQKY